MGGTTPKSQGQNYRRTDEKSRREAKQFFEDNVRRTMHSQLASQPYSPLVTLMTADYLLTAMDLPGCPVKCDEVSFIKLLKETFKLLESSYFEKDVLSRELHILYQIAKQHDLVPLFTQLYNNTIRKVIKADDVYGFVISNSIRFDGSELGLENIFDASLPVKFIYNFYNLTSWRFISSVMKNQIDLLIRTRKIMKDRLSDIPYE